MAQNVPHPPTATVNRFSFVENEYGATFTFTRLGHLPAFIENVQTYQPPEQPRNNPRTMDGKLHDDANGPGGASVNVWQYLRFQNADQVPIPGIVIEMTVRRLPTQDLQWRMQTRGFRNRQDYEFDFQSTHIPQGQMGAGNPIWNITRAGNPQPFQVRRMAPGAAARAESHPIIYFGDLGLEEAAAFAHCYVVATRHG